MDTPTHQTSARSDGLRAASSETQPPAGRRPYVPAVGPRLRKLLFVVLGSFALLVVNSVYLVTVKVAGWATGHAYENYFSLWMYLVHIILGLLILIPVIAFGLIHLKNARTRPNRRAVRAGLALFTAALLLLLTGVLLTRIEGFIEVKNPDVRSAVYWSHVILPLVVVWLFVLHRLAGPRIRWRVGGAWTGVAGLFAVAMVLFHAQDPRRWNEVGPASGEKYFFPSLARTSKGNFIDAKILMNDDYCQECHPDIHRDWAHGVHRFSSFNNPAYLFSVRETRRVALERDGDVQASRFCAGCHDPVVFFSGAFDDPDFDDENHPTAQAGITCTSCHAITHINTVRGNADFTIEEPIHYPFAFSGDAFLKWVNLQLVKAKPEFHKKTFLKPLHQTAEFCGTCHKVHLPEELNKYKFLRGQNHYDAHLLSGVSGHGVTSFYYPPKAKPDCNECHMPLSASDDFGAQDFDDSGILKVHNHQFPSANTAIPQLLGMPEWVNEAHREFLDGVMRVDIFAVKDGGTIDGRLVAPLRPDVPTLEPGKTYLIDTVIRTVKMGHVFTQGTADSNEVWLDVTVRSGARTIGRSGGMGAGREVDPWSHFVNAYVLDRHGNRIDRRNAQDIFVPLYNHQIPPGAADVIHYLLRVPPGITEPITVEVKLQYRKFDTTYMRYIYGADYVNELPVTTLATDLIRFPVPDGQRVENETPSTPTWERWNDYGIGLLRKGNQGSARGELRQAAVAFGEVERLGRPEGPLHLARTFLKEGRLTEAAEALRRAAAHDPPARPWSVAYFTAVLNQQNGNLDEAIQNFVALEGTQFNDAVQRGFDFSRDYRLLNALAQTLFERSKLERGNGAGERRELLLRQAMRRFQAALEIDPENVTAHYGLSHIYRQLGRKEDADRHQRLHSRYRPDDNARDRAISLHRSTNPAANHAAEAIVIYDLHRLGAYELDGE